MNSATTQMMRWFAGGEKDGMGVKACARMGHATGHPWVAPFRGKKCKACNEMQREKGEAASASAAPSPVLALGRELTSYSLLEQFIQFIPARFTRPGRSTPRCTTPGAQPPVRLV